MVGLVGLITINVNLHGSVLEWFKSFYLSDRCFHFKCEKFLFSWRKERLLTFREEEEGGWERVMTPEERVLWSGWTEIRLYEYMKVEWWWGLCTWEKEFYSQCAEEICCRACWRRVMLDSRSDRRRVSSVKWYTWRKEEDQEQNQLGNTTKAGMRGREIWKFLKSPWIWFWHFGKNHVGWINSYHHPKLLLLLLYNHCCMLKCWIQQNWTQNSVSDGVWIRWPIRELCCHLLEFHLFSSATGLYPVIMDQISIRRRRLDSEIVELPNLWVAGLVC